MPIDQDLKLYMAANDPKRLQIIERATHDNICEVGGELYWRVIDSFVEEAKSRQ